MGYCKNSKEEIIKCSCKECTTLRKKTIAKHSIAMIIIFIVGMSMTHNIVLSMGMAGMPWGWKILKNMTLDAFLIFPLVGLILYPVAKIILSFLMGIIIFPYYLIAAMIQISFSRLATK